MSNFKCSLCDYTSYFRPNVKSHINKKNKCYEGIPEIIEIHTEIICEHCKKSYASKPNLIKHQKICKNKKTNLEEKVVELEKKLAVAEALAKKPTIGTQNNININLASWNNPLLPDDVEKYYREAVKKIFLAVPTLIKYIHFNTEHPENHNICIKNARSKTAKVYNGKEWETMDEDELITSLISDYENTLEDYSETKKTKIQ